MRFSNRSRRTAGSPRPGGRAPVTILTGLVAAAALAGTAAGAAGTAAASTGAGSHGDDAPVVFTGRSVTGSAYGVSGTGVISLPATPQASSATEQWASQRLVSRSVGALLGASALSADARSRYARASLTDLNALQSLLRAESVTAECVNGRGSVRLMGGRLAGRPIDPEPARNTTIPVQVPGLGSATVTMNKQQWQPDRRLAVTALSVGLRLADNTIQTIDIGSATCGCAGAGKGSSAAPTWPALPQPPAQTPSSPRTSPAPQGPQTPRTPAGDAAPSAAPAAGAPGGSGPADAGDPVSGPESAEQHGSAHEAGVPTPVRGNLAVTG